MAPHTAQPARGPGRASAAGGDVGACGPAHLHQSGAGRTQGARVAGRTSCCETGPKLCHLAARVLRPRLLLALVHRADWLAPHGAAWFVQGPPCPTQLLALAPHVAEALRQHPLGQQHRLHWGLLAAPCAPAKPCTSKACLKGFVVQGTLRQWRNTTATGLIRDYTGLWGQLGAHRGAGAVRVTVLGSGGFRKQLAVPPDLDEQVEFRSGLPYPKFWNAIHRSWALVPAFGNGKYLTSRISSTMLASLTACVPIIASRAILDVYTFLRNEHVFLQGEGEGEVDVMVRVLAMDDAALFAKRSALCKLREEMARRSAQVIREALELAPETLLPPVPPLSQPAASRRS
ncbi:hypothetical protein HYH03_003703 [Edaphochlamys debaryana]|uniref:Exostosin GT47 domain-containing protein n=1 Tax=Edaphochlamys debaryana TaxID=47281 RepID=A0A836C2W1_9CHLO|nr:hypothetical protein HYH03_003703 [Edaphochlamys debaryana]|eukprot:KAG2498446.1 hypothetical protein HYH03_003703 [Edaphochlamys debaryana]